MCGIAGIYSTGSNLPTMPVLQAMAAKIAHRGPDGDGYFLEAQIGFAHTRLAIIDIETGKQPIFNEDGTLVTVFNGEIYNYIELRAALEARSHQFYTHSDTEVIVHLYEEYGDDFVSHLNGQFSIALWDKVRQRLVLARDRIGITPLFYTREHEQLIFASEIKALIPAMASSPSISREGLNQVFTHWCTQAPRSCFENISELPPGHILVAQAGKVSVQRYWDFSYPEPGEYLGGSENELCAQLYELLYDSTKLRLRADVPVAAYLSGGLDSSALVSLVKRCTGINQRSFSIQFETEELDESSFQREMINHIQAEHQSILCTTQQTGEDFSNVIWHTEAPLVRTAAAPMKRLSRLVADSNRKVVLTGEGADEILGGYDIFKEAKVRHFWARQSNSSWRPLLLKRLYPYLNTASASAFQFTRNFYGIGLDQPQQALFSHLPRMQATSKIKNFLTPELRVPDQVLADEFTQSLPPEFYRWDAFCRSQYIEKKLLLRGYLLSSQGDRMLMANSVEGRYPFLDHRLIEFAGKLDPVLKMKVLREKYLLKKTMSPYLPKSIIARYKQPYRAPDIPAFFSRKTPDFVTTLLSEEALQKTGYFDCKKVTLLANKAKQGNAISFADNMSFVSILSTQLLHHHFIN